MIHKLQNVLGLSGAAASGLGLDASSQTVAQNGAAVNLTKYDGAFGWAISAGTFAGGSTLDAKIQDSADGTSFADITNGPAITQLLAAGGAQFVVLESRVRAIPRRYARIVVTPASGAVVFGATFIGQPRAL